MVLWLNLPRHLVVKIVDGFFLDDDSWIELNAQICCVFSNALQQFTVHTYAACCATLNFLVFQTWFSSIVKFFITHMRLKWVQKKNFIENQGFATEK